MLHPLKIYHPFALLGALVLGLAVTGPAIAAPQAVTEADAQQWIRHICPLPQQISVTQQVQVPAAAIVITAEVRGDSAGDPRIKQAVHELTESLGNRGGTRPSATPAFSLRLELAGEDTEPLRAMKNSHEAYRIFPEIDASGLRLVALEPAGLLYAARTLAQLIAARAREEAVSIPLLEVTDWPDLDRRGVWGADSFAHTRWLAAVKMNHQEQIAALGTNPDGHGFARLKAGRDPMVELGPPLNVHPVPAVLHLEQVGNKGVFDAHPELRATGGGEGAICYSQPAIVDVLADWIAELGSLPGVNAVDVWMSENLHGKGGCQCETCRPQDRAVMEANAVIAAWRMAQDRIGPVGLYLLTSEETESSNPKVLTALPAGVRLWYYHSLRTYTAHHMPMIQRYLTDAAERDQQWIGVCPSLVASVGFTQPFTGAGFIQARMKEFVDRKMSGVMGYVTPRLHYNAFNLEAAAEWSWNVDGRTPREFAESFAVRNGISDPELFAEWSETIGPPAWDLHGSHFPAGERRKTPGPVARLLRRGGLPGLGQVLWGVYPSPWGQIRSPEQLQRNAAQAGRAIELAGQLGEPMLIAESEMVHGYAQAQLALWELKQIVSPAGIAKNDRAAARRSFAAYVGGLRKAAAALPAWEATVRRDGDPPLTEGSVAVLKEMIGQMEDLAADLDITPEAGQPPRP